MPSETAVRPDPEFVRAFDQFRSLLDPEEIDRLQPMGPAAVYTACVVVRYVHHLVRQRLCANGSPREAVVEILLEPARLPDQGHSQFDLVDLGYIQLLWW